MALQLNCPKCGRPITVLPQFVGREINCSFCQTLITVAAPQQSSAPAPASPTPSRPANDRSSLPSSRPTGGRPRSSSRPQRPTRRAKRSKFPMVAAAGLVLLGAAIALGVYGTKQWQERAEFDLGVDPPIGQTAGETLGEKAVTRKRIAIGEGFSFELPWGFYPMDRIEKSAGEVCYTLGSRADAAAGCTLCVIPKRSASRQGEPPLIITDTPPDVPVAVAEINGMFYLEKDRTETMRIDDMPAFIYRIAFEKTRRGRKISNVGWFLYAMDDRRVLTMRMTTVADLSVPPSREWKEILTSLRREPDLDRAKIPLEFR